MQESVLMKLLINCNVGILIKCDALVNMLRCWVIILLLHHFYSTTGFDLWPLESVLAAAAAAAGALLILYYSYGSVHISNVINEISLFLSKAAVFLFLLLVIHDVSLLLMLIVYNNHD